MTLLKLRTYISIAALLVAGLCAGAYLYWVAHRPWTTNSPSLQNGIELISIQRVLEDRKPTISTEFNPDTMMLGSVSSPTEIALFRVPDVGKIDKDTGLSPRPGNLSFFLTSRDKAELCKLPVKDYGKDCTVVGVQMPDVCPPSYRDGSLVAKVGDKVLGEWKMSGVRVAPKLIPDSSPNIEEVDFNGLKVKAKANYINYGPGTTSFVIQFLADREPVNGDLYEAVVIQCKSSYRAIGGAGALPFDNRGGLGAVLPLDTDASSKRVEVVVKLRRYRTHDEHIVVKNVHIEPIMMCEEKPTVFLATFGKDQQFVTPSGIDVNISERGDPTNSTGQAYYHHAFGIRIRCDSGFTNVHLPSSPLFKSTGKPVSLTFSCDNWQYMGSMFKPNKDGKTMNVQFQIPYEQNKAQDIADLKLTVRQRANLEEKTVRFVVPISNELPGRPIPKTAQKKPHSTLR